MPDGSWICLINRTFHFIFDGQEHELGHDLPPYLSEVPQGCCLGLSPPARGLKWQHREGWPGQPSAVVQPLSAQPRATAASRDSTAGSQKDPCNSGVNAAGSSKPAESWREQSPGAALTSRHHPAHSFLPLPLKGATDLQEKLEATVEQGLVPSATAGTDAAHMVQGSGSQHGRVPVSDPHLQHPRGLISLAAAPHRPGGLCPLNWPNTEQITPTLLPEPRSRWTCPKNGIAGKSDLWNF